MICLRKSVSRGTEVEHWNQIISEMHSDGSTGCMETTYKEGSMGSFLSGRDYMGVPSRIDYVTAIGLRSIEPLSWVLMVEYAAQGVPKLQ